MVSIGSNCGPGADAYARPAAAHSQPCLSEDLQKSLLHAFTGNIACDRRIFILATDLVDFIDIDDPLLTALHVAVGRLQQFQDDVLDILADIAGFR